MQKKQFFFVMVISTDIKVKLETIKNLPTLPVVLERARQVMNDPQSDARRLARIIEDDPSMVTRILRIVNSPLYAGREPINSLELAIARLGWNAVNNIALTTSVFLSFGHDKGEEGFDRECFWRHCISTGIVSSVLYEYCQSHIAKAYSKDLFHLVGLVHDIGKIIFDQYFHDDFIRALKIRDEKKCPLKNAEFAVFNVTHSEIGGWLAEKWNLPSEIVAAIMYHHDPMAVDKEYKSLVLLCHSANYICNHQKIGDGGDLLSPELYEDTWKNLGLTVYDIVDIVERAREEASKSEILMALL